MRGIRATTLALLALTMSACGGSSSSTAKPEPRAWTKAPTPEPMTSGGVEGAWLTDWGELHITRTDASRVTGAWKSGGGPTGARGMFVGRLDGNVLRISWHELRGSVTRSGEGYVVFTTDGKAFYGRWWSSGSNSRGGWTGWRPGAGTAAAAGSDTGDNRGATEPSIDAIRAPKRGSFGAGTCFAVSPDGLVATAAHVITGARTIRVRFPKTGSRHIATLVRKDDESDLALLRIARRSPSYLPLSKRWPRLGEKVFTIGFPYTFDLGAEPKFSEGVLSSRSVAGIKGLMQISMPIQPGNSGGPLVNHEGEVTGVVFARADDLKFLERTGSLPQNVAFAVAAGFLRPMLPTPRARPATTTREAAIDRAEAAVCSVLVER